MSDLLESAILPYYYCLETIIIDIVRRGCSACPLHPCIPKKQHTWECRKALELHYDVPGAKELWELEEEEACLKS